MFKKVHVNWTPTVPEDCLYHLAPFEFLHWWRPPNGASAEQSTWISVWWGSQISSHITVYYRNHHFL